MILLTIPVFLPIIMGLDWGLDQATRKAIWFGIPRLDGGRDRPDHAAGRHERVHHQFALAKDVPMKETFRGVLPFLASDLLRIVLIAFFPAIALWLVHLLGG